MLVKGTTKTGYKFELDDRILKDWRFIQALAKSQKGTDLEKLESANDLVNLVIGQKNIEKFMSRIQKNNEGYIPIDAVMLEINGIIESIQAKN